MDIGATVLKVGFTKVWTFSKLYLFCIPLLHILYLVFRQWVPSPPQTGARAFKTKLASQLQSANNPLSLQRSCCINRRCFFVVEQLSPFHKANPKPTKALRLKTGGSLCVETHARASEASAVDGPGEDWASLCGTQNNFSGHFYTKHWHFFVVPFPFSHNSGNFVINRMLEQSFPAVALTAAVSRLHIRCVLSLCCVA